jgi:starch phosphorylase
LAGRQLLSVRRQNKLLLAARVRRDLGLVLDPDTLFDEQAKRIHEYKRQLLNLLHVVARYQAIVSAPDAPVVPRTVLLAGKAAPRTTRPSWSSSSRTTSRGW